MSGNLVLEENEDSSRGLVVVPGISSGPFGSPFDEVVESMRGKGFSVVRVDDWSDAEDLEELNLEMLHSKLDEAYQLLKEDNGCEFIGLLGKSFGGQLGLTWPNSEELDFMVLWAPAVGLGKYNVNKWRSTLLKHAQLAIDISVDKDYLEEIDVRTKIIHGTEDEVVDVDNSKSICEALPRCEFSVIENADHSFTDKEEKLVDKTLEFVEKI